MSSEINKWDEEELLDIDAEENDRLDVSPSDIYRTAETSGIRMTSRDIMVFVNEYGRPTPILIVAQCKLDGIEYAALYDTTTTKRYVVEMIRERGEIKGFRNLDGMLDDEAWGVISHYFLQEKVYEKSRIDEWIISQKRKADLSLGKYKAPGVMMKRWEKRYERATKR